jgi:hypothetical protein
LLLLIDPELSPLPWEALPAVRGSCGSVGRCFSAALARHLLAPPGGAAAAAAAPAAGSAKGAATVASAAAAAAAPAEGAAVAAGVAAQPAVVNAVRLTYIVDPLHEESDAGQQHSGAQTLVAVGLMKEGVLLPCLVMCGVWRHTCARATGVCVHVRVSACVHACVGRPCGCLDV